jgi:hypothetical protein
LQLIIVAVVAVFVPPLVPLLGPVLGLAAEAAIISVVSQGISIAVGLQDKFSFAQVGLAAVTAGVSKGLEKIGAFAKLGISGTSFGAKVAQGALTNAATQGIATATGLQAKFDWTAVAAAGVLNGVSSEVGKVAEKSLKLDLSRNTQGGFNKPGDVAVYGGLTGAAGAIAGATTRSLVTGTDFGDNILAALPDVIGSTIGNLVAGGVVKGAPRAGKDAGNGKTASKDPTKSSDTTNAKTTALLSTATTSAQASAVVQAASGGRGVANELPAIVVTARRGSPTVDAQRNLPTFDYVNASQLEVMVARERYLTFARLNKPLTYAGYDVGVLDRFDRLIAAKDAPLTPGFNVDVSGLIDVSIGSLLSAEPAYPWLTNPQAYSFGGRDYTSRAALIRDNPGMHTISGPPSAYAELIGADQRADNAVMFGAGPVTLGDTSYTIARLSGKSVQTATGFKMLGNAAQDIAAGVAVGGGAIRAPTPVYRPSYAIEGALIPTKFVPNPNGKNGGPLHQAQVGRIVASIEARSLFSDTEYYVATPNGTKRGRFIDVVAYDRNRNVVEAYQVGKQTKAGIPVARERVAIIDVTPAKSFKAPVVFIPYNDIGK